MTSSGHEGITLHAAISQRETKEVSIEGVDLRAGTPVTERHREVVYIRVYRQRGFSLRSKGAHEIMWRWHLKIQNMAKFSRKIAFPIGTRGQKRSNFPKMSYISRNPPVVQKLEQLEQNRKKHLKAHSAGYRRLHIGFELKSVLKRSSKVKIAFYVKIVFRE